MALFPTSAAPTVAGSLAAAVPFLPQEQRLAIGSFKGECTALGSGFFQAMAELASGDFASADSSDEALRRRAQRLRRRRGPMIFNRC